MKLKGLATVFLTLGLVACGGGGGGGGSGETAQPISYSLSGAAVKGPWANATITVYEVDTNAANLKGELVASITTSAEGWFSGLTLVEPGSAYYLLEAQHTENTTNIVTKKPSYAGSLTNLVTLEQIIEEQPLFATPLSTLAVSLTREILSGNSALTLSQARNQAETIVRTVLGFDLIAETPLYSASPLVNNDSSLDVDYRFRLANEALALLIKQVSDDTQKDFSDILEAIAEDLSDAQLDGMNAGIELSILEQHPDYLENLLATPIRHLSLPDTDIDGDNTTHDPLALHQLTVMLQAELAAMGGTIDFDALNAIATELDIHPLSSDTDGDGYPDVSDPDDDNDGVADVDDAFPLDDLETIDTDGDGIGNNADTDDDNDGVTDADDAFPVDDREIADTDGDGIGNNADDDDDNDGTPDARDAFPTDSSETADTDDDGVGDNGDKFPTDSACWREEDGESGQCYLTYLKDVEISHAVADSAGLLHFVTLLDNDLYVLDPKTNAFSAKINLNRFVGYPGSIAYSAEHQRVYIGFESGYIYSYDPTEEQIILSPFTQVESSVRGLASVGKFLLAQDNSGAWNTHYIFDEQGQLKDSKEWNRYSRVYAWDANQERVYFFRDGTSPNDLHYEVIDQSSGNITSQGETPYHGDYSIIPPITISPDGQRIVLGSGDIYAGDDMTWQRALGGTHSIAAFIGEQLVIVREYQGNTLLYRFDQDYRLLEEQMLEGRPIRGFANSNSLTILVAASEQLEIFTYQPSNDVDQDGVENKEDAFPADIAASVDTDADGYPDEWNEGFAQEDSTTGLAIDFYPNDSACYLESHGDGLTCDFNTIVPAFAPDQVMFDSDGIAYMMSLHHRMVYRWSSAEQGYINPIRIGTTSTLTEELPSHFTLSEAQSRIYFGYASGKVTYADLDVGRETLFAAAGSNSRIGAVGENLLVQDYTGAWASHYIYDSNALLTDQREWNHVSAQLAWSDQLERVFYYSNHSPRDIHYEDISTAGIISAAGELPYHGDFSLGGALSLSPDSELLLTGTGHVFETEELIYQGSLDTNQTGPLNHELAVWNSDYIAIANGNSLWLWQQGSYEFLTVLPSSAFILALQPEGDDLLAVVSTPQGPDFTVIEISDHDGDGLPGWWEHKFGLDNSNADDALLDGDSDGLTNTQEFQSDTDPTASDSDRDGLLDGEEVNSHQTNPLVSDSDGDGLSDGDEVITYLTNPLSTDSDNDTLSDSDEINLYTTNPLSADSDNDGMGDAWELSQGLDPVIDDAAIDQDDDQLTNLQEFNAGTDPLVADTDGDMLEDGEELSTYLTNPLSDDSDGDKVHDGWEISHGLDPLNSSDAEFDNDGDSFTTLEEFYLGSDPTDSLSLPVAAAWSTQLGSSQRRAYQPLSLDENNFNAKWIIDLPTDGRGRSSLAIRDGVLLQSSFGRHDDADITAYNAYTGQQLWKNSYVDNDLVFASTPSIYADKVYLQTGGHSAAFIRALELSSGSLQFKSDYGNQWSSYGAPAVDQSGVYIAGGYYGGSTAFELAGGQQKWFSDLVQEDNWGPALYEDFVLVYPGENRHSVSMLAKTTGENVADIEVNANAFWQKNSYVQVGYQDDAYLVSTNKLQQLDLLNHRVNWEYQGNFSGQAAIGIGEIAAISNGALVVIDTDTGSQIWAWEAPQGAELINSPIISKTHLFVATSANTYAIDLASHMQVWSYPEGGELALSNDETLYIKAESSIVAVNLGGDTDADGMPDWWENAYALDKESNTDATTDLDEDGLTNLAEYHAGTRPDMVDTDGDSLSDFDEINTHSTNPTHTDTDADLLTDGEELDTYFTDPLVADSDGDNFTDGQEVLIYETDPLNSDDRPQAITSLFESFEDIDSLSEHWNFGSEQASQFSQSDYLTYDGSYSLASGTISHNESVYFTYGNLFAAGQLSFFVYVDAETCCDFLELYIDDEFHSRARSGSWEQVSVDLEQGEHTIKWVYKKDGSVSHYTDAIYIDQVEFTAINP